MVNRYRRLSHLEALGPGAPDILRRSSVLVLGCGALGTAVASLVVRSGVGRVRLLDRDVIEESNLADQCLYTEQDVAQHRAKAEVAAERLAAVNSEAQVEGRVADFGADNAKALVEGVDLIFDATDNLPTKYLLNDVAVATGTPWVYAGCAGRIGSILAVIPGRTHCLRCVWPQPPSYVEGCETMGLVPATAFLVAAIQVNEGLKVILGRADELLDGVLHVDIWTGRLHKLKLAAFQPAANRCLACGQRDFQYLNARATPRATVMCSRQTVLVTPDEGDSFKYESVLSRLTARFQVTEGPGYLRFATDCHTFFVYQSGRALVHGTNDPSEAQALYKRYLT